MFEKKSHVSTRVRPSPSRCLRIRPELPKHGLRSAAWGQNAARVHAQEGNRRLQVAGLSLHREGIAGQRLQPRGYIAPIRHHRVLIQLPARRLVVHQRDTARARIRVRHRHPQVPVAIDAEPIYIHVPFPFPHDAMVRVRKHEDFYHHQIERCWKLSSVRRADDVLQLQPGAALTSSGPWYIGHRSLAPTVRPGMHLLDGAQHHLGRDVRHVGDAVALRLHRQVIAHRHRHHQGIGPAQHRLQIPQLGAHGIDVGQGVLRHSRDRQPVHRQGSVHALVVVPHLGVLSL